jgi:hypothetical protein
MSRYILIAAVLAFVPALFLQGQGKVKARRPRLRRHPFHTIRTTSTVFGGDPAAYSP